MTAYFAPVEWTALLFAVGAVFVLRRRTPDAPRPFKVPAYPWVPLFFVVSTGISLVLVIAAEVALRNYAPLLGLAVAGAGFPMYALWRRLSLRAAQKT